MSKLAQKSNGVPTVATTTEVTAKKKKKVRPAIKVGLQDGYLIVSIPWDEKGTESSTGKSMIHASTVGNTQIVVDGKIYSLGLNVYAKK